MSELYVNIALNVPIDKTFTYSVPDYLIDEIEIGKRVLVSFGKKSLTGLILSTSGSTDLPYVKSIKTILDEDRIISDKLIEFCKWVAEYYIAPVGEVIFSAIPRNINIRSEIYYSLTDDYLAKLDQSKLKDEILIQVIGFLETVPGGKLTKRQISKRLNSKDVTSFVKKLLDADIITKDSLYTKPSKEKLIKIKLYISTKIYKKYTKN